MFIFMPIRMVVLLGIGFLPFTLARPIFNLKISEIIFIIAIIKMLYGLSQSKRPVIVVMDKVFSCFLLMLMAIDFVSGAQQFYGIVKLPDYVNALPWAFGKYEPSITWLTEVVRTGFILLLFIVIWNIHRRDESFLYSMVKALLVGGGVAAAISIFQLVIFLAKGEASIGFTPGALGADWRLTGEIWATGWFGLPRINGPNNEPSTLASTMVVILPLTLYAFLYKRFFPRCITLLFLLLTFLSLILSSAIGPLISAILSSVLILSFDRKYRRRFLISFLTVILAIAFTVGNDIIARTNPRAQPVRVNNIIAAWRMFLDFPLLGVGAGNFPFFHPKYSPFEQVARLGRQYHFVGDNLWLVTLAEKGLLGLLVLLSLFIYIIRSFSRYGRLLNRVNKTSDREALKLGLYAAAGFLGSFLALTTAYGFFNPHIWINLAIWQLSSIKLRKTLEKEMG